MLIYIYVCLVKQSTILVLLEINDNNSLQCFPLRIELLPVRKTIPLSKFGLTLSSPCPDTSLASLAVYFFQTNCEFISPFSTTKD